MTPQEYISYLLEANDDLIRQYEECERENAEYVEVIAEMWDDYSVTYPATAKEIVERHPIMGAFGNGA